MSKFAQKEDAVAWKPSFHEANDLSDKLKLFSKKEMNGKMQYPLELFLFKEGVISFDQFGRVQVVNPFQYHRYTQINSLREWLAEKDMQNLFQSFPEEKELFDLKIAEWIKKCRQVIRGFGVDREETAAV